MAKLKLLNARTCTVEVLPDSPDVPGGVHVTYKPSNFQQELLAKVEAMSESESTKERLAANTEWIESMITHWDVEADESTEKNPVYLPVETEHIVSLGIPMQSAMIKAVVADMKLGEENRNS